jgi:hypothetical protein
MPLDASRYLNVMSFKAFILLWWYITEGIVYCSVLFKTTAEARQNLSSWYYGLCSSGILWKMPIFIYWRTVDSKGHCEEQKWFYILFFYCVMTCMYQVLCFKVNTWNICIYCFECIICISSKHKLCNYEIILVLKFVRICITVSLKFFKLYHKCKFSQLEEWSTTSLFWCSEVLKLVFVSTSGSSHCR